MASWFGGNKKKKKVDFEHTDDAEEQKLNNDNNDKNDKNDKNDNNDNNDNKDNKDNNDEDEEMKWFDDIIDGADTDRGNKQILSKLWEQITGENMLSRLMSPQQRYAGKIWGKLCHRVDVSYPKCNKLKAMDVFDANNISEINEIRYAVRHAIASYPPSFIVFLGLKGDIAYAFKSNKKLLKSAFNIESKDVIIDNCTNNLIASNSTHQPSFYLCLDHDKSKIIISIRGSSSLADALTDVNAVAKEYSAYNINGYCHEGIMASTRFVFDNVTKPLVKLCNQYKSYQVIITGHSLGAGVASCLGFMYNDHPIIHKQNNLKVYSFASPCILSQEFVQKICLNYVTTIALSTDLVTRLSLESVKQQNCRLDAIMKCNKNVIKKCMMQLKDKEDDDENDSDNDDNDDNDDDDDDDEKKLNHESAELIKCLKEAATPNPKEQLYPLGKILWFVPKCVMDHDDVRRRKVLMCIRDKKCEQNVEDADNDNEEESKKKEYKTDNTKNSSFSEIFSTAIHNVTKGFEEFQETMDNSILNAGGAKYSAKYDGSNYILCEATKCRDIFQELVLDLPESLYSHMPNRYLWACDAHLTRGKLHE